MQKQNKSHIVTLPNFVHALSHPARESLANATKPKNNPTAFVSYAGSESKISNLHTLFISRKHRNTRSDGESEKLFFFSSFFPVINCLLRNN